MEEITYTKHEVLLKVNYIGYTQIKYKKLNKNPHNTQLKDWTLM